MFEFQRKTYYDRVSEIIKNLKLSNKSDNDIIKNRFLYEVVMYESKRDKTKKYYNEVSVEKLVGKFVKYAIKNKLDGVGCSPYEIKYVSKIDNGFIHVVYFKIIPFLNQSICTKISFFFTSLQQY